MQRYVSFLILQALSKKKLPKWSAKNRRDLELKVDL